MSSRMLGAARLSHFTDSSTSVKRQSEQIEATATARGDKLIHITEDMDTSGAVSPFERDELGPWLTDPELIAKWDTLCITKLDRLTRSIAHFVAMVDWCTKHGKTIVSIGDSFDLGTPVGRMVAHILALFAQFERERMAERRKEHTRKALSQARWDGRSVPPGYSPVKVGDHWELEPDEDKAQRIVDMASAIIDGQSARQVGQEFGMDSSGVLSILRNQSLRGYVMHDDKPVRDENGLPVQRTAILDDETWTKLQTALDRNGKPGGGARKGGGAMLLGVGQCGACGQALYILRRKAGNLYRHADGGECKGSYSARILESAVESALMGKIGHVERTETHVIPGENHDAEINRVEQSIGEIESAIMAGDMPAASAGRMLGKLEAKLTHLNSLPSTPDRPVERPTGVTYGAHWEELDTEGRGAFLRENGIKLIVSRDVIATAVRGGLADAEREVSDAPRVVPLTAGKIHMAVSFGSLSRLIESAKAA